MARSTLKINHKGNSRKLDPGASFVDILFDGRGYHFRLKEKVKAERIKKKLRTSFTSVQN